VVGKTFDHKNHTKICCAMDLTNSRKSGAFRDNSVLRKTIKKYKFSAKLYGFSWFFEYLFTKLALISPFAVVLFGRMFTDVFLA